MNDDSAFFGYDAEMLFWMEQELTHDGVGIWAHFNGETWDGDVYPLDFEQ